MWIVVPILSRIISEFFLLYNFLKYVNTLYHEHVFLEWDKIIFIFVFSNNKHNHEESLFIIIYMTKINLSQVWQVMSSI